MATTRAPADQDAGSPVGRPSGRAANALRAIALEVGAAKYAEGSCLVKFGDTHVLCAATIEERMPGWLRGAGRGWVTAEYGMLPRSTHSRTDREAARGKQSGRTQEIQRLIGRALRAVTDLEALGEMQIRLDCDVSSRWRHPHSGHHRRLCRSAQRAGRAGSLGQLARHAAD